ncbi:hypothetical protein FFK22_012820 [Mycobacterium sp. KBS0706]|nr:hypothetical protein FFK22_012820 [Mycobacterium sp. KBS0706]
MARPDWATIVTDSGLLARFAALHVRPGIRPRWWVVPAWLFYDALGLFVFTWIIIEPQKVAAQLAAHTDVVKIALPAAFFSLSGIFLPMMHIVTLLAHWTKRRRKPALGLREKQWWSVLGVIFVALILLSLIANWTIGVPLRERAAAAGYIECGSLFDREDRQRVRATYALSADLCRQAGFKRSRIEPDFDTPRSPG